MAAYPAKDRPIRDPRLLFAQPDRINAVRVFSRERIHATHPLPLYYNFSALMIIQREFR